MSAKPLRIAGFGGLTPRVADRLLPDSGAIEAINVILTSGEIRPMRPMSLVHVPSNTGPWLSAYRAEQNGAEKWRAWDADINIAAGLLTADVEQRYYWTGDGEPRYSTFTNFGTTDYALGVPNPITKPGVSHAGGTGSTVSRYYVQTFFSALGEESGPGPVSDLTTGKTDGTWSISNLSAFPVNSGTGTASGQVFTDTVAHWLRVGDQVVISASTRTVTAISGFTFTVDGAAITGATSWARKAAWNTSGMKRRLYRSAGTAASFQLVHDDVGTTYSDTLTDAQILGDDLISASWVPPPPGLKGIIALPNGAMYGFVGNQYRYSEPFQPHAWPAEYSFGTDYEVVGAAAFGTAVVIATAGTPYVADGVEPSSVTQQKINSVWPCLSKRSVISIGDGVLYSTNYGMAYIGSSGSNIWTAMLYTIEEWSQLNPSSICSGIAEGRVFLSYTPTNGSSSMMIFHPSESAVLTELAIPSTELYPDPRNGNLYIINEYGINLWNSADGEFLTYTWRSKEFELPEPVNYGAAKVDFSTAATAVDAANAQANYVADVALNAALIAGDDLTHDYSLFDFGENEIGGDNLITPRTSGLDSLTFTLFIDGVEKFSRTLLSSEAFRLPDGYKSDNVSVQVSGTVRVRSIKLAETLRALKAV